MLMAVNIGNSRISVGIFEDSCLCAKFQIATDLYKTSDEYLTLFRSLLGEHNISKISVTEGILSSVVPQLTDTVKEAITQIVGKIPLTVGPGVKTGFPIKIDTPSELGGDIVADVAAVLHSLKRAGQVKTAAVVAHMGTVTTVSAINKNGEFIGCSIFPGVRLSLEALHGKTAQLPNVSLFEPERVIAKNSQDSVRSGVIHGHAMMLDGFVGRFAKEMKCHPEEMALFITGKDAKYVTQSCKRAFVFEEDLTLHGLYVLFCNATQNT